MQETVVGLQLNDIREETSTSFRQRLHDDYIARGRDYANDWNMWTALDTYLQLQELFGWSFYTSVWQQYYSLPVRARQGGRRGGGGGGGAGETGLASTRELSHALRGATLARHQGQIARGGS